jgi:hypothetical protein
MKRHLATKAEVFRAQTKSNTKDIPTWISRQIDSWRCNAARGGVGKETSWFPEWFVSTKCDERLMKPEKYTNMWTIQPST